ncbi:MAG: helix-turn-helix transcriptional regulator [Elusimicrobia bacterium]|nr:helix-turn-helix transcriptional regulator [Elusimicrobiota bacterium]
MSDIYMQIGGRIREVRSKQNLTLEELSSKADLNWSFLARIETGKAIPSIQSLVKIAKELKIPLKDLFSDSVFRQDELLDRQATSLIQQLKTSDKTQLIQVLKLILSPPAQKTRKK